MRPLPRWQHLRFLEAAEHGVRVARAADVARGVGERAGFAPRPMHLLRLAPLAGVARPRWLGPIANPMARHQAKLREARAAAAVASQDVRFARPQADQRGALLHLEPLASLA